jgi:ribosomal protein L34
MCNEHQGQELKKARDHEYEVRMRRGETVDLLARG